MEAEGEGGSAQGLQSLVPIALPKGGCMWGSQQAGASGGRVLPKAKAKAKAKAQANPLVYAATSRAKTAKSFLEAEKSLEKALKIGKQLVDETAPKLLGDEEQAESDPGLALVRSRICLVEAALDRDMSGTPGPETTSKNLNLFQLCLDDPYLRDCRGTILDEQTCQTLKSIKYNRNVTLNLYPDLRYVFVFVHVFTFYLLCHSHSL